jgi:hypothetical protein
MHSTSFMVPRSVALVSSQHQGDNSSRPRHTMSSQGRHPPGHPCLGRHADTLPHSSRAGGCIMLCNLEEALYPPIQSYVLLHVTLPHSGLHQAMGCT